jgi:two-component system osmolarity sensor histidine kinase EnvZ
MKQIARAIANIAPKSFMGQTLAMTISVILVAQIMSTVFAALLILKPQVERVGGILAQAVAATSDAAELSSDEGRIAIIARLNASEYLDVMPGDAAPPPLGRRPNVLERVFMQSLVDSMADRTELLWRTDEEKRLWVRVHIGPDAYWLTANAPRSLNPLHAILNSAFAAFALSLLAAVLLQRRISQPLEALTAAVVTLNPQSNTPIVPVSGPSEIVALSQGFNAMIARLATAEQERALMLAGVSHDVRTPLAKLRLTIELLSQGDDALTKAAHAQVQEIDRVLSKFLMFARGFEDEAVVEFNLEALTSEVAAMHAAEGVDFTLIGAGGDVFGRPEALRRALVNITENAVRHGAAPFAIRLERNAEHVTIIVTDHGAGVAPAEEERLLRPFARGAAPGVAGSGLGLAIAGQVARLHGGALTLERQGDGAFAVRLSLKSELL